MTKKSSSAEDARAGTGMFSTARRFFTEARQYLLAVSAAIAAFGGIQLAFAKIGLPRWFSWFALVPLLLVFLFKTVPRWWTARGERILVRRSKQAAAAPPLTTEPLGGYFIIGPYPEERRQLFQRADGIHETVLRWIRQTHEAVLVLTGGSGTGKSSVLQAFVLPVLREGTPPCTSLLLRSYEDPLVELRRQLALPGVIWAKPPAGVATLGWDELLTSAVDQLRRKSRDARLVVVLDQFEELVILEPAGSGTPRAAAMREFLLGLRRQTPDGFTLLLTLRSDYKIFLEALGVPPLQQGVNWEDVPAFRQSDASEFLSAPATGFQMPDERLQRVLTEAAAVDGTRGLIRPIILNMLGVVLRRIAGGPEAEQPTRSLLADDLRRVINDSPHREIIRPVLLRMMTDADTKRPRAIGELAQETGLDPHAIQGCLLDLELSGYVRPLSQAGEVTARVWEISHDFVARLIGPILKVPFRTLWRRGAAVLYPLSLGAWILILAAAIVLGPGQEQANAEGILRNEFHFHIETKGNTCLVTGFADSLDSAKLLQAIRYLSKMPPATIVNLGRCHALTNLDGLKELKSLQELYLGECSVLTNLDGIRELKSLRTVSLGGCVALTNVDGLKDLKNLQTLYLGGCKALKDVDALTELKSLQYLTLSESSALTDLDGIRQLKSLRGLDLSWCVALTNVDVLKELRSLEGLNLSECHALLNVDGLKELKRLRALDLSWCTAVTNVAVLKELKNLEALNLSECHALLNVDALRGLKSLQTLDLSWCTELTDVGVLKELKGLQRLNLGGCSFLTNVEVLIEAKNLQMLDLSACHALTNVDGLKELKNLQMLDLSECEMLANVDGLKELKGLKKLNLGWCHALTKVDALKELKSLETLNLSGNEKLSREAIERLKQALPTTEIGI